MPASPEPRASRGLAIAGLGAVLLALAVLLWAGRAELPEHLARWSAHGQRASASIGYVRLSAELDATALGQHLGGLPLQCRPLEDGSICEAALAQADGVPATRLRATWHRAAQQNRLQTLEILVPWWAHHRSAAMLTQRLGPPSGNEALAASGERLAVLTWNLPQGRVLMARAPGWNPWRWSTLRWSAPGTPPP